MAGELHRDTDQHVDGVHERVNTATTYAFPSPEGEQEIIGLAARLSYYTDGTHSVGELRRQGIVNPHAEPAWLVSTPEEAAFVRQWLDDYVRTHPSEATDYVRHGARVRTMMTTRWVDPDPAFTEYAPGEHAHAVVRAGVEVMDSWRSPAMQRLLDAARAHRDETDEAEREEHPDDPLWMALREVEDAEPQWLTLDLIEFEHPIVAPPGRHWVCTIEGGEFLLAHVLGGEPL